MNVLRVGVAFDDAPDSQPEQGRLEQPDRKDGLRVGRHADQPEHAPHPKGGKQLFHDGSHRGGVDGVVRARRCDLPDLLGQRAGLRVDGVGGAELGGQRPPDCRAGRPR